VKPLRPVASLPPPCDPVICFVLDTETTGGGKEENSIIQLAAVLHSGESFSSLIRPRINRMSSHASSVHNLTLNDLKNAKAWPEVWREFLEWISQFRKRSDPVYLLAHNGKTADFKWICRHNTVDPNEPWSFEAVGFITVDTMSWLNHFIYPHPISLPALSAWFQVPKPSIHSVLDDMRSVETKEERDKGGKREEVACLLYAEKGERWKKAKEAAVCTHRNKTPLPAQHANPRFLCMAMLLPTELRPVVRIGKFSNSGGSFRPKRTFG
jgi:inhibitor of KinA sporulation pathway (predicted exonuclease)